MGKRTANANNGVTSRKRRKYDMSVKVFRFIYSYEYIYAAQRLRGTFTTEANHAHKSHIM